VALLRHGVALVVGMLVALAAIAVHRSAFPLGLLLAVATTFAVPWWLLGSRHPRTATSYAAGWLAMLAVVVAGRPEGDYALGQDLPGYALVLAGVVLVVVGLVGFTGGRRQNP
jgi:hypothetical protein